ncbi:regucalcin-like [Lycorma delicatula]|uniref:regucalcin-like n=1 Tax=Lycorma delicatula TaxID=130591 RepID=UPI003F512792
MQRRFKFQLPFIFALLSVFIGLNDGHVTRQSSTKKQPALYTVTSPVNHGEGPHWDIENQALYFVDISGFTVHCVYIVNKTHTSLTLNDTVSFIIPIKKEKNKFVIGLGLNVEILTWDGVSDNYELHSISSIDKSKPGNRLNDAKADPSGLLWAGTMGSEIPPGSGQVRPNQSALYSWSTEGCEMQQRLDFVTISNGMAWSRNGSLLFYIDSTTRRIDTFDYNGTISNRRVIFDMEEQKVPGFPDGMTIDENDHLWIACWGASRVIHVDPNKKKLLKTLKLPVEKITSVTFGGKFMDILFITSMKDGLNSSQLQKQPLAGTTFAVTNLGVKGQINNHATFKCNENILTNL